MKRFFRTAFFFISVMFIASCSSDDSSGDGATFILDGETYQVSQGTLQTFNNLSDGTSDTTISLVGNKGTTVSTISFRVFYNTDEGIEGTYVPNEDEWTETLGTYSPWLSSYSIVVDGQDMTMSNEPVGSIKITSHGGNQYTLEFDVTYNDDVVASANAKTTFTTQNMNID